MDLTPWSACVCKQLPLPLGDDFDRAVNDLYSGLIVNRIRWHGEPCGPGFCIGQGGVRMIRVIQVRNHCKVNQSHTLSRDQEPADVSLGGSEHNVFRRERLTAALDAPGRIRVGLAEGG